MITLKTMTTWNHTLSTIRLSMRSISKATVASVPIVTLAWEQVTGTVDQHWALVAPLLNQHSWFLYVLAISITLSTCLISLWGLLLLGVHKDFIAAVTVFITPEEPKGSPHA